MHNDLQILQKYCENNQLLLNFNKFHIITLTEKKNNIIYNYNINDNLLKREKKTSDTFDRSLTSHKHIDNNVSIECFNEVMNYAYKKTIQKL